MKQVLSFLTLLAVAAFSVPCNAEIFLDYGTLDGGNRVIDLQADTAGQEIQIFASGLLADGGANGFEIFVQIGDGGAALGGSDTGPVITNRDLITGTIWEANGPSQFDSDTGGDLLRTSTVDTTSLVTDDGLVATITLDTTGILASELVDFRLSGIAGGSFNSRFFNGATTLVTNAPNGMLRINAVPEPGSAMVLAGLGLFGLGFRRRRG